MNASTYTIFTVATPRRCDGFSMLELLLGVVIFSFAMLPMLSLSMSSSRGAFSVGKHMMATQIAQSLLDRYLAMKFDEAHNLLKGGPVRQEVVKDPALLEILELPAIATAKTGIHDDFLRAFRNFKYEVLMTDGSGADAGQAFLVRVKVEWLVEEGTTKTQQFMSVAGIKYRDDR